MSIIIVNTIIEYLPALRGVYYIEEKVVPDDVKNLYSVLRGYVYTSFFASNTSSTLYC
jgi:hypothetical protein